MPEAASFEPKMIHPEQVSSQITNEKPWLRQKHEPANWYLRFKRYLDLGPKRSLRAVLASEPSAEKATRGNNKKVETPKSLSEVSVPGAWSRAAKVWNWKERALAYDLAEQEKEAQKIRNVANEQPFSSRAYRIAQLNFCARTLEKWLKEGIFKGLKENLAMIARYQSVMRDIEREMQGLDSVTQAACDSAAMGVVREEIIERKYKKQLESKDTNEHNRAVFERMNELERLKGKRK